MSSRTLCSVLCLGKWETIMLNPGRSKFNGIRTTIISADWIELMDKPWNSSGRFPQDSLQWQSSMRFNRWWGNYSVNQRTWHAASSFMTIFNDIVWDARGNDELCVNNSRKKKQSMRKDSLAVTGLSWIWKEVNLGIELQRKNAAEFRRNRSSYIPRYQCLGEKRIKKQRKWKEVNTLQWQHPQHWVASPSGHLRQSAQYLRTSSGYDWRITSWSESSWKTCCIKSAG